MPFTKLLYHINFSTKKRRRWLKGEVGEFCWKQLAAQAREADGVPIAVGGYRDHGHMLVGLPPKIALSKFIMKVKRNTTRVIRREFGQYSDFSWQKGYGAFTVSPSGVDSVADYVRNQEEHHRRGTIIEELERFWEEGEHLADS